MQSKDIRAKFIEFFESRGHTFVPSSPVVPNDDPTLLFANAGMNQFKPIFLGQKQPEVLRAVNSQKCIRAGGKHNDLEEVGKDGYHHTFFEMLGNWSFGDYYKKEAISWAWELLTGVYGLPKEKLHATVYKTDQEAYELWKSETDIIPEHITFHGDKDNFWEMGDTGPCGPCSEIHFDRGAASCEKHGSPGHVCEVNGDCSRYIELWNLVFIQYNRDCEGSLNPLKHSYVDTGAGLERICQVMQGVSSNYDTDLFSRLLSTIATLSGKPYSEETGISHRVIADHIRSLCFALADGGFPSNEGRGYVLRRILRRAARHGRLLGFFEPFLWKLVDTLIEQMGDHFTELKGKTDFIKMVIKAEEERFNKTLDTGLIKFSELTAKDASTISGADAFMLYDTFGFPLDLTQLLADEKGMLVDTAGFEEEMTKQRERARAASKFALQQDDEDWVVLSDCTNTEFLGYTGYTCDSRICRYCLKEGGLIHFVLDKTPFYAESGGQIADSGTVSSEDYEISVSDVRKTESSYIHIGKLERGIITSKVAKAVINESLRRDTARNHTATHILHKALRDCLGESVQQKGSLVTADYFRFDFTHFQALTDEEIAIVEAQVNEIIRQNRSVFTRIMGIEDAKASGAMALFGEKYSQEVRVVQVDSYSSELCGGTHVSSSGEIGLFRIKSESSSAAGIRRIEGVTGRAAYADTKADQALLKELAALLQSNPTQLKTKLETTLEQIHKQNQEIRALKEKLIGFDIDQLLSLAEDTGDYKLIKAILPADTDLKLYRDLLASRITGTIAVLITASSGNVSLVSVVSKDLIPRYSAGKIVQALCTVLDGKGGGKPDFAMGGGKDNGKLTVLLDSLSQYINPIQ